MTHADVEVELEALPTAAGVPIISAIPPSAYGEDDGLYKPTVTPDILTPETDADIRCGKCAKLLAEFATRPYQVRCPRCKTVMSALPRTRPA